MDIKTFELLCEASQLSFKESEKAGFMQSLDSLIEFTSVVKQYDCAYNPDENINLVPLNDLRKDVAEPSCPPEKLLANTEALFDCYVIPKIME